MEKKIFKRSMALGALMAFVITGSAMAQVTDEGELKGETGITIYGNDIVKQGERTFGGWRISDLNTLNSVLNEIENGKNSFSYTVAASADGNAGKFDEIVGGSYISGIGYSGYQRVVNVEYDSINTVIENAEAAGGYIGGNRLAISSFDSSTSENACSYTAVTNSTTVTIKNGVFGTSDEWLENINGGELAVTSYLAGGDVVKDRGYSAMLGPVVKTTIGTATTNIDGGTFNAPVIGGSILHCYAQHNVQMEAMVNNTVLNINGGDFNGNIYAGGAAIDGYGIPADNDYSIKDGIDNWIQSNVGTATVTINNINTEKDVYTGGLVVWNKANDDNNDGIPDRMYASANVDKATLTITNSNVGNVYAANGTAIYDDSSKTTGFEKYDKAVETDVKLTNVQANIVDVQKGSVLLSATADSIDGTRINTLTTCDNVNVSLVGSGETNDALNGNADEFVGKFFVGSSNQGLNGTTTYMEAGKATGQVNIDVEHTEEGTFKVVKATEQVNPSNAGANDMSAIGLMSWRAETDDMNKRMGELRDANGEHGVWVRMVRGEDEYGSVKNQYNQYQIGYDEKLSVDKRWTVGAAISYTDAENSFAQGNGESTNKALSLYGSKLNNDGTYVDLIAKYARLENDFKIVGGMGDADYSTNGYSFSAEAGKRIAQGNGLWIEPQVQLTYGKVSAVDYVSKNGTNISQDSMESIIGRVGFRLGKDIKQGNVYARASYLYDFDGETETRVSAGNATRPFENDLGGGWWEVGVGTNINLSKSTYIYADVEKTFGGEVDTNWQWNLGVRYSF